MKNKFTWLTCLPLFFGLPYAVAESLSSSAFEYNSGPLGYLERNELYSAWNPNDPTTVLKPGMKVLFFGRAEGCGNRAANGPVKSKGNPRFGQALELTGIPLASEGKGQHWAPSGDSDQCVNIAREQVGDSFVHVNEDPVRGGIGMFTFTGPDQTGRRSFFRQFNKEGKNGTGANANIKGTFVAFRFDWQRRNSVFPWAIEGKSHDQRIAEFKTTQSVATASAGDATSEQSGEPAQAKQQFILAFINQDCIRSSGSVKRMCQLQYLFNLAVFRAGVNNWDEVKWFKDAGIFADPAQGGMPVVHGPIGRNGATSIDNSSRLELYTSRGEASHHDLFKDKSFIVQVSFAQFKNALRAITARQSKKKISGITSANLINAFGKHWDDPEEWQLLSINVSQEVHNPVDNVRAYIGGGVKEIGVSTVRWSRSLGQPPGRNKLKPEPDRWF